jgi:aspartate aminotransferase
VIDLSVGEPDFSTPDHIKEAAARAIRNEATKYTALDGTIELKVAIQEKFRRENNISYGLNEVTVSAGAKQILFNALMASLNIGDEVIIPTSAWVSYTDIVAIAGGKSVFVPCREKKWFQTCT